ncbi:uncharacterized protein LOC125261281 [Megalobrama amblycephala]|uniref:uncharacterized protein LOC125261281 n=1 Tax=Megalobrama amblycephala TaxID=75352 RepID=UPI0020143492|nr:uncharacterized protein LOC125261281 [Megalobrama amblycephala]
MAFNLQSFVNNPSLEVIEKCRKDELLIIANHFQIAIPKQTLKKKIKAELIDCLIDSGVLSLPVVDRGADLAGMEQNAGKVGEGEGELVTAEAEATVGATLPPFEPFSPVSPRSTGEAQLRVRIERLRMEARERAQSRQAELDLRLQVRKLEIEADKEVKLRQLDIEAAKAAAVSSVPQNSSSVSDNSANSTSATFDVGKHIALVPSFRETEVDSYFNAFERIATSLGWPKEVWSLLLQCKLAGKALEVYSTLSLEDSLKYEVVKLAVLKAYELVPEAYRQQFRTRRKNASQTYVEFARDKGILFDRWCASSKVDDFTSLRELMLLEDFKQCLPERMVLYLNEQKVTTLSQAAVLADEFVLTHRNVFQPASIEKSFFRVPTKVQQPKLNGEKPKEMRECFYCHKKGHVIADCLTLKRKQQTQTKEVAFVNAIDPGAHLEQIQGEVDSVYVPFLSKGYVSLSGKEEDQVEVRVLRDTGAAQSFVCADVLPFSDQTSVGSNRLVQSFSMEVMRVPVHRIHLQTDLVSGFVEVGVRPALPVKGVSFILGNDLAGGKVVPSLEVVDTLTEHSSDDLAQKYPSAFTACVITRAQSKKDGGVSLFDSFLCADQEAEGSLADESHVSDQGNEVVVSDPLILTVTREKLIEAQKNDISLVKCFKLAEKPALNNVSFLVRDGLLVRKWHKNNAVEDEWNVVYQVVVPSIFRQQVLSLAHDHLLSGHLGVTKTYNRVLQHFFWYGLKRDVVKYCKTCHVCQYAGKPNQVIPPAPLIPIPVIGEPFEHVIVDCVGPLPKTKSGNQFLLTIMCSATRYPEAIPLRKITSRAVVKVLTKFFTTFGLPRIVQTDQGTNFLSKLCAQVFKSLNITHRIASAYHPESQGSLERFHQTLKAMLRKYCLETGSEWDEGVPLLLFSIRETVQESLKFSPSELVFGHTVRGPLKVLKERMLGIEDSKKTNVLDYVSKFRDQLQKSCMLARETLAKAQGKMKMWYDKSAVNRSFAVGDQVLVLLPVPGSALTARFSGPYEILEKRGETDYVLRTPDRRRQKRVCHINMLKAYHTRDDRESPKEKEDDCVRPVGVACDKSSFADDQDNAEGLLELDTPLLSARLSNSETLANLSSFLAHLNTDQRDDIIKLLSNFSSILGDTPTLTNVLQHDINVGEAQPIKQHPYRVNFIKRAAMKKETQYLLEKGLASPSLSAWSSPCLLVQKSDGTARFCTDYRRVNAVTVPDCFPMPRIEDCVDSVGSAKFVSKLDLLKGYWQVPLTPRASEISAFVTPDCFLQYRVMAFGLRNAAATFQRLVNLVLADVPNCNAYLDDIVVYSQSWSEHVSLLETVFKHLQEASLTLNFSKCEIGKATVTYLGKQVGYGQVRPVMAKISAINDFPVPKTRRELRRFLGMAGFYRCFCRNFSSVAAPLTTLLSPSEHFVWSTDCQTAFENIKVLLCSKPVLSAPNFSLAFKLEVDASDLGAGAVLIQEDKDGIDHPVCYFSKKFNRSQRNYSTIEKEALALLLAIQHFEVYVGSSVFPVTVYTDHNPLTFISRMRNQNQRLMRWSLIFQNYNLEIRYKKGTDNVVADALSRV